jgi:hypothetical protein
VGPQTVSAGGDAESPQDMEDDVNGEDLDGWGFTLRMVWGWRRE